MNTPKNDPVYNETNTFIREWGKRCNLTNRDAHLIYELFCTQLISHLLAKNSLNMGAFIVHPCPYRANWKDQVFYAMNWVYQLMRGKNLRERWRLWHEGMGAATFCNHSLLAGQRGLVYTRPEIQISGHWWLQMIRMEKAKRKTLGPFKYKSYVLRGILKLYERMVATWMAWRAEISLPGVRIHESGGAARNQHFVESRTVKSIRATDAQIRFPPPSPVRWVDDFRPEVLEESVRIPDAGVPPVPALQPPAEDVRDGREDGVGLPVLHAREGNAGTL